MRFKEASDYVAGNYDWVNQLLEARSVRLANGNKGERKESEAIVEAICKGSFLEDSAYVLLDREYWSEKVRQDDASGIETAIYPQLHGPRNINAVLSLWLFNVLNGLNNSDRQLLEPFIASLAACDPNIGNPRSTLDELEFTSTNRVLTYQAANKANNTLFELVCAAAILKHAVITSVDDPSRSSKDSTPEFRFQLCGKYWAVECKTVEGQLLGLLDLVEKAWSQVAQPDKDGKRADSGLAIVNVSRLLPDIVPRCGHESLLKAWLAEQFVEMRKEFESFDRVKDGSFLHKASSPALSGFLIFGQVAAADDQKRMVSVTRCEWWSASETVQVPEPPGANIIMYSLMKVGSK